MASFGNQLSFFLLLVLVISPKIQAREGKVFSLFTHFRTIYNAKDPQVPNNKAKAESPAPTPEPIAAPTPAPAPSTSPATGSTIPSGPAPEPEFFDRGDGYGLYGKGSSSNQYSPTKETQTTTTFENELLNEDFNDESYKTGFPKTNFHNNYDSEEYRNNYNNEEYRNSYNNGYNKNYVNSYSNNFNNLNNEYEINKEGMSDTRFLENGKYYYHVNTENENYNLNGYESGRGSTENEGYFEKNEYPNEFDTMEEYEKQQASQGYTP
ncbi:protein E6 [Abrus precatorius]|uniref:Protein E6 n=1 Tax=Abrus precatorius TaxID=3816 RepID=A0A8B8KJH0_ABRPR|nr:protein E6 [Abrus precatorius]